MVFSNCSNSNAKLESHKYASKKERVETLKKVIISKSEFTDAEFELFNVNGFSNNSISIPGTSSVDYKFVIKVKKSAIDKWTAGMTKFEPDKMNIDWMKKMVEIRADQWITKSKPEFYKRQNENVIMIVFRNEGIIYKRIVLQ